MVMAPGSGKLVSALVCARENFIACKAFSVTPKQDFTGTSIRTVQNLIPENCILSPSDKNLGISILPPSWYEKEYAAQVIKGGYELQQMTEDHCVKLISSRISYFKGSLSEDQRSILRPF